MLCWRHGDTDIRWEQGLKRVVSGDLTAATFEFELRE